MNPRTRQVALYALAAIAIAASGNALAHSYAGLYGWAVHHRLTGWQAMSWPAEIDIFLAVGELALYVAYLDRWPIRQRVWPWATALVGLAVSVAGNFGHIQPVPGHPVGLTDRLTAATSPLAAFAGLTVGLLVLRMNGQQAAASSQAERVVPIANMTGRQNGNHTRAALSAVAPPGAAVGYQVGRPAATGAAHDFADASPAADPVPGLLRDARAIGQTAAAPGERLSQRALARQLRGHGHRFPNGHLHQIAAAIGLDRAPQHASANGR